MAAKLLGVIPPRQYEIIRDRIAVILGDEFAGQYAMQSPPGTPPTIGIERAISIDKEEVPFINVSFGGGDFSNKDQKQKDGSYTFYIDCYTSAESEDDNEGDKMAQIALHKLMGMCDAILENPQYKTLDFTPPSIRGVMVRSMIIDVRNNTKDALSETRGRLEFVVNAVETVELITPELIGQNDTVVKIALTDKGYQYQYVNI